ncbi:MAG: hypothetical protein ACTSP7_06530 [Candidatus Heimdallarchaeota archaeon]
MIQQITLPRKWYLAIAGLENWVEKAQDLPVKEFTELKGIIDNFLSRLYRDFRKRGAFPTSLLWSQENLAPSFMLEPTRENEKFLKEMRVKFNSISDIIFNTLTTEERNSNLGKNIQSLSIQGRILLLECEIPSGSEMFPDDSQVTKVFSDAFNSELLTIKRSEHDYPGRKHWLAPLESIIHRELIRNVGPVKKLREAKEIEGKRLYEKSSPGDFEKITRVLSEAVPYRPSLFALQKPLAAYGERESLGHIIIQYLASGNDLPIKLSFRSNTHERPGRKIEELNAINEAGLVWKDIDKLVLASKDIIYSKIEKKISDVGGVKFDALWTERDLSSNVFFLSKFSFTEDVLKEIKTALLDERKLLEEHIGIGAMDMLDLWRRSGLNFNTLILEVKGLDADEDKNLINWIKALKEKKTPGPSYSAEKETLIERYFRPL